MAKVEKDLDGFTQRFARVMNPRAYAQVNGPAVSIAVISYIIWVTFYDTAPGKFWSWQNILLAYLVGSFRSYFYVIYLYFKFDKRRKYFSELHAKMESERTFWGHVANCCMRTSCSACVMQLCNILGMKHYHPLSLYIYILCVILNVFSV